MNRKQQLLGVMVGAFTLLSGCACRERVDPGNVGVLLDYGQGTKDGKSSAKEIETGTYVWVDIINQKLVEYPVRELTLTMVKEGAGKDDDAVLCQAQGGASLSVDVSAVWQIMPDKAADLYFLRPGEPLEGDINKSIEGSVVRTAVRNAINLACAKHPPTDIMADKKSEVQDEAERIARDTLRDQYINLKQLFLRGAHPPKELEASIAEVTSAQQKAEAAKHAITQAYAEATANAVRRTALTVEEQQRQDIINKWDGRLPQYQGNANPVIDVGQASNR